MKRIFITGLALMGLVRMLAQEGKPQDSTYRLSKLKIDEINLVSSYYSQTGDNAAVTGGRGSEKLTDISNIIDVNLVRTGKNGIKHTYNVEVGVDHYSSASSDRIDLQANSSASSGDIRVYPSLNYIRENDQKGKTFAAGLSSSTEYDYQSFGGTLSYGIKTRDQNGEFTTRFQAYLDQVKLIAPIELRNDSDADKSGTAARHTFLASLAYSQVINRNLQILFQADLVTQQGYLSLPFHRVYFLDESVGQEKLPDSRFKIPLAVRASYFWGDRVILRAYYRYYRDDWGITSHTASLEIPVKVSPFLSFSPFYRHYTQTAADYFDGYRQHDRQEDYYTSNHDLSAFDSKFMGLGVHFAPVRGIFGIERLTMLDIRMGHYTRSNGLKANSVSLNLKFK